MQEPPHDGGWACVGGHGGLAGGGWLAGWLPLLLLLLKPLCLSGPMVGVLLPPLLTSLWLTPALACLPSSCLQVGAVLKSYFAEVGAGLGGLAGWLVGWAGWQLCAQAHQLQQPAPTCSRATPASAQPSILPPATHTLHPFPPLPLSLSPLPLPQKIGKRPEELSVVSVMPCVRKQGEADRMMFHTREGQARRVRTPTACPPAACCLSAGWGWGWGCPAGSLSWC